jgi:hypothetical protein
MAHAEQRRVSGWLVGAMYYNSGVSGSSAYQCLFPFFVG